MATLFKVRYETGTYSVRVCFFVCCFGRSNSASRISSRWTARKSWSMCRPSSPRIHCASRWVTLRGSVISIPKEPLHAINSNVWRMLCRVFRSRRFSETSVLPVLRRSRASGISFNLFPTVRRSTAMAKPPAESDPQSLLRSSRIFLPVRRSRRARGPSRRK